MGKKYCVAVVGVGVVGEEIIRVLEELEFPCSELIVLASRERREVLAGRERHVLAGSAEALKGVDIALFAGTEGEKGASSRFGWAAAESGTVVIDNGADFRMDPRVPLVVPEVNPQALRKHANFIANPNCSTIQMVVALAPLHKAAGIKRVVVNTYQAVSGTGREGKEALTSQRELKARGEEITETGPYLYPIFDNAIPQIGSPSDAYPGYFTEEVKMIEETRKILGEPQLRVTATCIRVPVINSHGEAINVQFEKPLSAEEAREILSATPGIAVIDDFANMKYPMPLYATGKNATFVGRIRKDPSVANGLDLWCVADNIRKGAATNAVQIGLKMIEEGLV